MVEVMRGQIRLKLVGLAAVIALGGCGGGRGPAAPATQLPGAQGLHNALTDARGAVAKSQQDAAHDSATSAGP